MTKYAFRTREVAHLYDEIQAWCHPEYPFLDPKYSPGSNMPAIDFTSYVMSWLAAGKRDAIAELWSFLTYRGDASDYLLQQALKATLPPWFVVSDIARHELHAIYLLTMRGGGQDAARVAGLLAATTLACRQVEITSTGLERLLKATQAEMSDKSLPGSTYGLQEGSRIAVEKLMSPLGSAETAAEKLKVVPPMSRLVVYDFIYRGWGSGLRFDLYYGERSYGCGGKWNQHYVEWLGFFGPPSDNASLPASVTKDVLRAALLQHGIECKKTETKKTMVERARGVPNLISSLLVSAFPEQRELRAEWKASVRDWALRVRYVEAVGAAIMQLMGFSAMK